MSNFGLFKPKVCCHLCYPVDSEWKEKGRLDVCAKDEIIRRHAVQRHTRQQILWQETFYSSCQVLNVDTFENVQVLFSLPLEKNFKSVSIEIQLSCKVCASFAKGKFPPEKKIENGSARIFLLHKARHWNFKQSLRSLSCRSYFFSWRGLQHKE